MPAKTAPYGIEIKAHQIYEDSALQRVSKEKLQIFNFQTEKSEHHCLEKYSEW